ncbi:MAG: hypothetical protein ACRC8S_04590 [Fimbriiglobus sp.]
MNSPAAPSIPPGHSNPVEGPFAAYLQHENRLSDSKSREVQLAEWRNQYYADANILFASLDSMFRTQIEDQQTSPDCIANPTKWLEPLLSAGCLIQKRGWQDLIQSRIQPESRCCIGYQLLCDSVTSTRDQLRCILEGLQASCPETLKNFTWQHILNSLNDRLLNDQFQAEYAKKRAEIFSTSEGVPAAPSSMDDQAERCANTLFPDPNLYPDDPGDCCTVGGIITLGADMPPYDRRETFQYSVEDILSWVTTQRNIWGTQSSFVKNELRVAQRRMSRPSFDLPKDAHKDMGYLHAYLDLTAKRYLPLETRPKLPAPTLFQHDVDNTYSEYEVFLRRVIESENYSSLDHRGYGLASALLALSQTIDQFVSRADLGQTVEHIASEHLDRIQDLQRAIEILTNRIPLGFDWATSLPSRGQLLEHIACAVLETASLASTRNRAILPFPQTANWEPPGEVVEVVRRHVAQIRAWASTLSVPIPFVPLQLERVLGFNPEQAAEKAQAFVEVVKSMGRYRGYPDSVVQRKISKRFTYIEALDPNTLDPSGETCTILDPTSIDLTKPQVDQDISKLMKPFTEWAEAINPNKVPFDELDQMTRFWEIDTDDDLRKGFSESDRVCLKSAIALIACFGWVARFWNAGSFADAGRCKLSRFLPVGLLEASWRAAESLRTRTVLSSESYPFRTWKPRLEKSDVQHIAIEIVETYDKIDHNLDRSGAVNIDHDFALFELLGHLDWYNSLIRIIHFGDCGNREFEDGNFIDVSAHVATSKLRDRVYYCTRIHALEKRHGDSNPRLDDSRSLRLAIPFWTPEARLNSANLIPKLKLEKWVVRLKNETKDFIHSGCLPYQPGEPGHPDYAKYILKPLFRDTGFTESVSDSSPPPNEVKSPNWDAEKRLLSFGVWKKTIATQATRVIPTLSKFQEAGWPKTILFPDSLPSDFVRGLNASLGENPPIRFKANGSTRGIIWDMKPLEKTSRKPSKNSRKKTRKKTAKNS